MEWCGQDARRIFIQTAGLVYPPHVVAHDSHGATGQATKPLRNAFADRVKQFSRHDCTVSDIQYEMRDARVVTKGALQPFSRFRVFQNSFQHPSLYRLPKSDAIKHPRIDIGQ